MRTFPLRSLFTILSLFAFSFSSYSQENQQVDLQSLDSYIDSAFINFEINGLSILIIKDDSIVFEKNIGTAGYNQDVNSTSVYNIASCTKAFTGAAMAKLVSEQKIHWDDLVIDYLPEFKLADPYITSHLTIEDLLTHRSGLGTFYGDLLWYETKRTDKDIIERLQYLPITNRFRDQYGYQNTMYMVAGEILKKVTGQSWSDYIETNFLKPLAMSNTVICGNDLDNKQDIAYPIIDGEVTNITMKNPHAAASLFSSTTDLSRWARMLLNNGILEGDTLLPSYVIRDMMTPRTIKSLNGLRRMTGAQFSSYALGWNTWDHHGMKVVEHAGGMPGYISQLTLVPQENLGIIILTNTLSSLPTALELYILDLYLKDQTTDWAATFLGFKKRGEKA
ncbi:MAG: serine hydrolase, partial [Bacteroidales bacterium]|nr:serine hydrolase [Bacteroidales bacterium]